MANQTQINCEIEHLTNRITHLRLSGERVTKELAEAATYANKQFATGLPVNYLAFGLTVLEIAEMAKEIQILEKHLNTLKALSQS